MSTYRAISGSRHAVQERRLGLVRQGQHQENLRVDSVCRPQRDDRSADGRYHGPHPGDAGQYGYTRRDKRVEKAVQFILKEQEPDGCWFGRWGVNYLYGTFLVLRGLQAMEYANLEPSIQQAAEWIRMVQNSDGGWGETCGHMTIPTRTASGPSTPSQTAWALLGLLAANDTRSDSVAKGVRWLIERQHEDGSWDELMPGRNGESYYTGTGFPRVFYLGYHLYKQYFPLLALTTYGRRWARGSEA